MQIKQILYHFSHPSDTLGTVPYMPWIIDFTVHHTWLMTPLPRKNIKEMFCDQIHVNIVNQAVRMLQWIILNP